MPVVFTSVTADVLDVAAHHGFVDDPRAGAVASFVGRIRNHDPEAAGGQRRRRREQTGVRNLGSASLGDSAWGRT